MKTTIDLNENLVSEAKKVAASQGTTLSALIEDVLRVALTRQVGTTERMSVTLTTVSGAGLQPGVNLDKSTALLERMDKALN